MGTDQIRRYTIIPTHDRQAQLVSLVTSLRDQCDVVIIVDNASSPAVAMDWFGESITSVADLIIVRDDEQPPNLSRLWNVGLDVATAHASQRDAARWDVAILNDDTVLPSGWYDSISTALRDHPTAAIACGAPGDWIHAPIFHTDPRTSNIMTRMTPWAFVTRGELSIRADESLRWWWGDTDFEWQARQRGGVLIIPGHIAMNSLANSTTHGVLAEQAGRDGETFRQKWGWRPW